MSSFGSTVWEDGERVITVDGFPVGQTLDKAGAETVLRWLTTAALEIQVTTAATTAGKDGER